MNNVLDISPEQVAKTIKEMSKLMNCDYETVWSEYTHQLIKDSFT